MVDLLNLSFGYLEAQGFEVARRGADLLVGNRLGVGEEREFIYLWVLRHADPEEIRNREGAYLARFKEAADALPAAQRILLVDSRIGLSRAFTDGARRWYDVKIRTPAQFFDTAFKWEDSPGTASALARLKAYGDTLQGERIPQPYKASSGEAGLDLLPRLQADLTRPGAGKPISLVVGPAGMGKSILLATLFAELHSTFLERKLAQELAPRPLVLLPEHIPLGDAPRVRAILRGFLSTEFARPLDERLFEWRVTHGLTSWLLDGLDEILSLDPQFFDDLLDLLTRPDPVAAVGPMRIVLAVRDTLLATNEPLRAFVDECGDVVEVFRLEPWDAAGKRRFAQVRLGASAAQLLPLVQESAHLDRLSGIPYFYSLLIDAFSDGELSKDLDEKQLLRSTVDRLLRRDIEKGIVDTAVTAVQDVIEFAESVAVEDLRNGFQGVPVEVVREWAQYILPDDLAPDQRNRWLANLTQLAFFMSGGLGQIQFSQELIEQFLLGQALLRALDNRRDTFLQLLSVRQLPWDWLAVRILADGVAARGRVGDLSVAAAEHVGRVILFKNLIQVLLLAGITTDALRQLPLEQRDLAGVAFRDMDLSGVSFRGSNLADTVFERCVLRGARFAGAILSNTGFERLGTGALADADFGDLTKCHSIRADGRVLAGPQQVRAWLKRMQVASVSDEAPCPTAQQLRHLFGKFVRPDGSARRSWLDEQALLRGTRFEGAADVPALVEAVIRHRYLVHEGGRDHVQRPGGDAYSEIVEYVRDLKLSEGLRALLDDVCPRPSCRHVPPAGITAVPG